MLPSSTKLTLFQRGIIQKCAVICTYSIILSVIALILDWFNKENFLKIIHKVHEQGSISKQAVDGFTILIESRDGFFFLKLIFIGVVCGFIGLLIIRQAAKLQWSKSVTLPKIIEFRQAMQHIGIHTPEDRIDFARKHKVPIFIASKPFLEMEQYNVPVRLYAFAYNSARSDRIFSAPILVNNVYVWTLPIMNIFWKSMDRKRSPPMQRVSMIWKRPSPICKAHSRYNREK